MLEDLYEQSGYTDRLLELLQTQAAMRPGDLEPHLKAAAIYRDLTLNREADEHIRLAEAKAPDDLRVIGARAMFCYRNRQFADAIRTLQPAVAAHPKDDQLLYRLSELQRAGSRDRDAEASIRAAIALKPNMGLYHRQLAHILAADDRGDKLAEAEREAKEAVRLGDITTDTWYWMALAIDRQKRTADAIAAYEAVGDNAYEKTAQRLGQLYLQAGKIEKGRKCLAEFGEMEKNLSKRNQAALVLKSHPEKVENWQVLAARWHETGDDGLAIALLRCAAKRFPNSASVRSQLQATLLDCGRGTEAKQMETAQRPN